jgi:HlyD family secretion protein
MIIMRRVILPVIGIGVLVVGLAAANLRRDSSTLELDWRLIKEPPREVLVEPPGRGAIAQTINAPGKIESMEEIEIASQIVGRVVAVNVKEGDAVKKDDVLVQLDDTDAKARLASALARIDRLRAAITQAESDVEKATREANQSGKLAGRGFSTPTELADARTVLAKAQAGLMMSRHDLFESEAMRKTSEQDLERTAIRAPIDGVVSGINVDVGEVVIAGTINLPGSVLMTVSDPNRMRVRAEVDETDIPLVRSSQPARVYLQADQLHPIEGSVDRIAPRGKVEKEATENNVVSFETLVGIAKDGQGVSGLRPGMTATVEIEVKRASDALGVPAQAVIHRRRKDLPDTPAVREWAERNARSPGEKAQEAELRYIKIVFVAEDGIARARPVDTGLSDERRVEILAGLKPDDRVIVGPFRALDELKDGHRVEPVTTLSDKQDQP